MCFYTFELDEASRNLCFVVTLIGKYRYKRLPMGVSQAPDLCQEILESIFSDMVMWKSFWMTLVFSNDYIPHMRTICNVLSRLQDNGFTVNPL